MHTIIKNLYLASGEQYIDAIYDGNPDEFISAAKIENNFIPIRCKFGIKEQYKQIYINSDFICSFEL